MKTHDDINDEMREQINMEFPRPKGGFSSMDEEDAWRESHEKRFIELVFSYKHP